MTSCTFNGHLKIYHLKFAGTYYELQNVNVASSYSRFKANNQFVPPESSDGNSTIASDIEDCALRCRIRYPTCIAFYFTSLKLDGESLNCQFYDRFFIYIEPIFNVTTIDYT